MASGSERQECVQNLRGAFTPEMYEEEEGLPHQSPDNTDDTDTDSSKDNLPLQSRHL